MSKIEIREVDLTTIEQAATITDDIVYVPGFSALGNTESAAKVHEPTLCTTVAEFVNKFGDRPALFKTQQAFPSTAGFPADAIPSISASAMFGSDTPDPSYIYARELLSLGLPVVYERVNEVADDSSESYDVNIETMYTFLSTNFKYSDNLSCTASEGIVASFIQTTGEATFVEHFPNMGRYKFTNIGKTAINIDYGSTKTSDKFTVILDRATFVEAYPTANSYTFTYSTASNGWKYNSTDVDLSSIGISYIIKTGEATPANGDKIVIKTIANGWQNSADDKPYELAYLGLSITGTPVDDPASTIAVVYAKEEPKLIDKNLYSIKYLTSGGYPTFEYNGNTIVADMINLCQARGDCIALIDHTDNPERKLTGITSVYNSVNLNNYYINSSYAAMFTPYCTYSIGYGDFSELSLPPSFAYLSCLGKSIANNPSWLAIAGAARGKVSGLVSVDTDSIITNSIAEGYQADNSVDINPITNIRPFGQCIWGNRTLVDNGIKGGTSALSFLNIRNLVCDVKKTLYAACQTLMFEQNTDVLWVNFLSKVTPRLDQMVSGYGLKNYKIIRQYPSDRSKIVATVRLYPVYAVESFDITLYLQDGDTTVVE